MATTGRKSKLTETLMNKMIELVKHGNYIETAAAACGITDRTFYNWLKTARDLEDKIGDEWEEDELVEAMEEGSLTHHETMCLRFFRAVKAANAEAEATAVLQVRKQMPEAWQAAMTFLERRYPGRWKRRDETTVRSPFDPINPATDGGVDERALLQDPEAVRLMHGALVAAARGELPETVDSTAVPMDTRIREDETE